MRQFNYYGTESIFRVFTPPQLLPVISEEAKTRLLEELGLDNDPRTRRIIQGISGETISPTDLKRSLTADTFLDLMDYNRDFVQVINDALTRVQLFREESDARSVGMAIVLRAFEISSGFDLLARFGNLDPQDIEVVKRVLQESLPSTPTESILQRLLTRPRIPQQQIALSEAIKKADNADVTSFKGYLPEGAAIMYKILTHIWPKLYPQNQTPSIPLPTD